MSWKEVYRQENYKFKKAWKKADNWQKLDFIQGIGMVMIGLAIIVVATLKVG